MGLRDGVTTGGISVAAFATALAAATTAGCGLLVGLGDYDHDPAADAGTVRRTDSGGSTDGGLMDGDIVHLPSEDGASTYLSPFCMGAVPHRLCDSFDYFDLEARWTPGISESCRECTPTLDTDDPKSVSRSLRAAIPADLPSKSQLFHNERVKTSVSSATLEFDFKRGSGPKPPGTLQIALINLDSPSVAAFDLYWNSNDDLSGRICFGPAMDSGTNCSTFASFKLLPTWVHIKMQVDIADPVGATYKIEVEGAPPSQSPAMTSRPGTGMATGLRVTLGLLGTGAADVGSSVNYDNVLFDWTE